MGGKYSLQWQRSSSGLLFCARAAPTPSYLYQLCSMCRYKNKTQILFLQNLTYSQQYWKAECLLLDLSCMDHTMKQSIQAVDGMALEGVSLGAVTGFLSWDSSRLPHLALKEKFQCADIYQLFSPFSWYKCGILHHFSKRDGRKRWKWNQTRWKRCYRWTCLQGWKEGNGSRWWEPLWLCQTSGDKTYDPG